MLAVIRIPSYLILVAEAMLQATGLWTFFNWLPLYFTETFHMSLAGSGFSGTFMLQVAAVVGITLGKATPEQSCRQELCQANASDEHLLLDRRSVFLSSEAMRATCW